jgi:ABC-type nitrate/sulfonate/bicarbonate transport system permease component
VLIHVRLVTALPEILSGMRVLLALAWTAVMGAELIAAESGLGWMIWHAMRYLQTDVIFVGVFTIAIIGALMDWVLALAWRLVGSWAPRVRGG